MTVVQGDTASLSVAASGIPSPNFSAVLKDGGSLPNWITLNQTTGELKASPPVTQPAGNTVISVSASNGVSPKATKEFTIKVVSKQYTITATSDSGGSISPAGLIPVNSGSIRHLPYLQTVAIKWIRSL